MDLQNVLTFNARDSEHEYNVILLLESHTFHQASCDCLGTATAMNCWFNSTGCGSFS